MEERIDKIINHLEIIGQDVIQGDNSIMALANGTAVGEAIRLKRETIALQAENDRLREKVQKAKELFDEISKMKID